MRVLEAVSMLGFGLVLGCSAVSDRVARGASSAGGGEGGSGGSAAACPYPPGPFGITTGKPLVSSLQWQGFLEGASQSSEVPVTDFHDCDGSKGIDAVLFDISATWCGACQQEAMELPGKMAVWKGEGIRVVTLMIEQEVGTPATVATAQQWKDAYHLDAIVTLADPAASLLPKVGAIGLPFQIVLDPRTMKITSTQEGYSGDYSAVLSLAAQNHP
jgi:thiol-disulfide isomerase/thioredoxin